MANKVVYILYATKYGEIKVFIIFLRYLISIYFTRTSFVRGVALSKYLPKIVQRIYFFGHDVLELKRSANQRTAKVSKAIRVAARPLYSHRKDSEKKYILRQALKTGSEDAEVLRQTVLGVRDDNRKRK